MPQDEQDIKDLLESGLDLWDRPLDRSVVTMGESYVDPTVTDPNMTYRYAVVHVNKPLPPVQYQIIEQLAMVPEDCPIAKEAFRLTGNEYFEPETFTADPSFTDGGVQYIITPPGDDTGGGGGGGTGGDDPPTGGECGCPLPDHYRKPAGCVQVFDNMLNIWEGVKNVEIQIATSQAFGEALRRTTQSDMNGCWKFNKKYHGKIHVWVKWSSSTCDVKTMKNGVDLDGYSFARIGYVGKFNGPYFNDIPIKFEHTTNLGSSAFRNWVASTINNAVYEFNGYAAGEGIAGSLPGNLQILLTPWGQGNTGAAPMLDKIGVIQQFLLTVAANAVSGGVFNVPGPYAPNLPLGVWLMTAAPDIVLNVDDPNQVNADDIREIMYHEYAHAMHFNQVGSDYWYDNINYTVTHFGYGNGDATGAGRCSVIESWGFEVGMLYAHLHYGINNSNAGNPTFTTWRSLLESAISVEGPNNAGVEHIPHGWLWDLQDNNATNPFNEPENGAVADPVTGFTNAAIFGTMTSSMLSMPQMKSTLGLPAADPLSASYGF